MNTCTYRLSLSLKSEISCNKVDVAEAASKQNIKTLTYSKIMK